MTITWSIRKRCPTINDWNGPRLWKYRQLAREWMREFQPASKQKAKSKRYVRITRIYRQARGQRRYDEDNLRGGIKPILDALKRLGWLVNDSPKWCAVEVDQRHPTDGEWSPSTVVVLSDLPGSKGSST